MAEMAKDEAGLVDGEDLAALEERFRRWRETRKRGDRIPSPLWAAAVDMARQHGVPRVASRLRLSAVFLHERPKGVASAAPAEGTEPEFVELLTAPAAPVAGVPECVVELHNARGATMRVELTAGGLAGLAHLCRSFWGAA
jgi:hypothetical protein